MELQAVIEIEKATATEEVMGHVKHKVCARMRALAERERDQLVYNCCNAQANSTKIKEQATVNQAQTREIEKLSKQLALALSQLQQLDSQFKSMEVPAALPPIRLSLPVSISRFVPPMLILSP